MSDLLNQPPYGARDEAGFVAQMAALSRFHLDHCDAYRRVFPDWTGAGQISDLPYLHVSAFKHHDFRTQAASVRHERVLTSSATSSNLSSRIALDTASGKLQSQSSRAILQDFIGAGTRPLIVLDTKSALLQRGQLSARIAAALALRPFASRLYFALSDQSRNATVHWDRVLQALNEQDEVLVYGFTWVLWFLWARGDMPPELRQRLAEVKVTYLHSGGWKKLAAEQVAPATFNSLLGEMSGPRSQVIDYYGLVEQNGVIFPECPAGWRHVPIWADVLGRDSHSHAVVYDAPAQLQLMNLTPQGAPYHNVLTEDLGLVSQSPCACGRSGRRFQLLGRLPKAELRGCANV